MAGAGYSGTPLAKKLGLTSGQNGLLIAVPESLGVLTGHEFAKCETRGTLGGRMPKGPFDYIHVFETEASKLGAAMPGLRKALADRGMMWSSWPKKASKMAATLTENLIRQMALANQLVDVKVCAVDEIWSGLKLVIPVAKRAKSR